MSDSYMGLDVESKFSIKVIPEQELPAYEVHPEDAELDEQPSLFAIQTEKDIFEDSDSEEDDEDDEDGKGVSNEEADTKKSESKNDDVDGVLSSSSDEDEDGI